jgi:hypothetical protein
MFLNLMLPWFVEVLVQDGAFFIHSFPNHPVTNFLKVCRGNGLYSNPCQSSGPHYVFYHAQHLQNRILDYAQWAARSQARCLQQETECKAQAIRVLNTAAKILYEAVHRRIDQVSVAIAEQNVVQENHARAVNQRLLEMEHRMQAAHHSMLDWMNELISVV